MAWFRTRRFGWVAVLSLLAPGAGRGQEALRSAMELDQTIAAYTNGPVALTPNIHHWGPVPFTVGAYAGTTYDDNINEAQDNPESDIVLSAGVNLGASWAPTGQSQLQLGTGIGYIRYLKNTQNSGLSVTPDSAVTYAVVLKDVTVTVFDQFSYSRQVITEGALANVSVFPQFDNTIGTRVAWNPERWTFQAGYSHDDYFSDGGGQNLNRSSEYFFGRGGWRFAESTEAGLEASESLIAYEDPVLGNSSTASVGAYANWQLRPSLKLTVRGGPAISRFAASAPTAGSSTLVSYYAGFDVSHQLTDFLSHRLSLNRSIQPGLNGGSAYIEQLVGSYAVNWACTQRIGLSVAFTYENGTQPLPVPLPGGLMVESIEQYDRYGIQPQISWRVTDRLSGSLSYSHWLRESNLDGRDYRDNSVTLNFTYAF